MPAAKKQQLLFQNRIQFLHSHHLVQSFSEFQKQTLWHGIGGGYLKHPCSSVSVQGFHDKLIADAMSDDAVSYTHLDVYKRQSGRDDRSHGTRQHG